MTRLLDLLNTPRQCRPGPATFRIRPINGLNPYSREMQEASAVYALQQWDDLVTRHQGEVQDRAVVFIDGERHYHTGFIFARAHSLHEHCDLCYAASKRAESLRGSKSMAPLIAYVLQVVRRTTPRKLIAVPLPVPVPRTDSDRIRKKWAKQAKGKTGVAYKTETIDIEASKGSLWRIRKALAEREERG